MTNAPAFMRNGRLDVLAANQLGYALYSPMYVNPVRPANHARFTFLDPRATEFYRDWDDAANTAVALLRTEAGRAPYDRGRQGSDAHRLQRRARFRIPGRAESPRELVGDARPGRNSPRDRQNLSRLTPS